jgi:SAM-dependent methyltransferase
METDPRKRFSSRVENYVKYRPKYPPEVLDFLKSELELTPQSVIADIGSGTGISSEMFLRAGNKVYGVEPNDDMRLAGERSLASYSGFVSVKGTAERTGLESESIDFVVAGQAFHWFDRVQARREFLRILKPRGWVVLMWNDRKQETSFSNAYEKLLKTYAIDYQTIDHRLIKEEAFQSFYGAQYRLEIFDNQQIFDRDGLKGRVLSCSYMPMPGHPDFEIMMSALEKLFDRYQKDGVVSMDYQTLVYYGQLVAPEDGHDP